MLQSSQMPHKLIVVKIGGSVLTYKQSSVARLRQNIIRQVIQNLKWLTDQNWQLIVVHGGGSVAHPLAQKYHIHKGAMSPQQIHIGLTIQWRMQQLSQTIAKEMLHLKLNPQVFPSHSLFSQDNLSFQEFDLKLINQALHHQTIPILYGDVVMDYKKHFTIVSGDTLVCYLAKQLQADKVVFLSDVDGVYNQDPKIYKNAHKFTIIDDQNVKEILTNIKQNNPNDISGEMAGKINNIKQFLAGVDVTITSGLIRNQLKLAVNNQVGTQLKFMC